MSTQLPTDVLQNIFNYFTTLREIAKLYLVNKTWNQITRKLFGSVKRQKWLSGFLESYLNEHDWGAINWDRDFGWTASFPTPHRAHYVDYEGNYFFYDHTILTLFKNDILFAYVGMECFFTKFTVDEMTNDVIILCKKDAYGPSTLLRFNESGVLLKTTSLDSSYSCNSIVAHGQYVYTISLHSFDRKAVLLKIDTDKENLVMEKSIPQANEYDVVLRGIDKDGKRIYVWGVLHVFVNYNALDNTFVSLDANTGEILDYWSTGNKIKEAKANELGFWYIYIQNFSFFLAFVPFCDNATIYISPISKFGSSSTSFVVHQLNTSPSSGKIYILGRESKQNKIYSLSMQQL